MSITDELRTSGVCRIATDRNYFTEEELTAIADRIDAKYDQMRDFCERLGRAATDREDVTLWGVDYTALPLDADGVPIRFGDKVTVPWNENVYEVMGFSYTQRLAGGEKTIWVDVHSREKMRNVPLCGPSSCRHYHEPTVEDMLWELLGDIRPDMEDEEAVPIVAAYAKRLRLADDGKKQ